MFQKLDLFASSGEWRKARTLIDISSLNNAFWDWNVYSVAMPSLLNTYAVVQMILLDRFVSVLMQNIILTGGSEKSPRFSYNGIRNLP
jgi:hypothetical protein